MEGVFKKIIFSYIHKTFTIELNTSLLENIVLLLFPPLWTTLSLVSYFYHRNFLRQKTSLYNND